MECDKTPAHCNWKAVKSKRKIRPNVLQRLSPHTSPSLFLCVHVPHQVSVELPLIPHLHSTFTGLDPPPDLPPLWAECQKVWRSFLKLHCHSCLHGFPLLFYLVDVALQVAAVDNVKSNHRRTRHSVDGCPAQNEMNIQTRNPCMSKGDSDVDFSLKLALYD